MLVRGHPNVSRYWAEIVPAMLDPGSIMPAVLHPFFRRTTRPESKTKPGSLHFELAVERNWLKKR